MLNEHTYHCCVELSWQLQHNKNIQEKSNEQRDALFNSHSNYSTKFCRILSERDKMLRELTVAGSRRQPTKLNISLQISKNKHEIKEQSITKLTQKHNKYTE